MGHAEDIPEPTRSLVTMLDGPRFDTQPFVAGPKLAQRRIAILSSAALVARGTSSSPFGSTDYLTLPADRPAAETLMSHVSVSFDR